MMIPDKTTLRRSLLRQRQALNEADWQNRSKAIVGHLKNTPIFQQAKTILAYFSIRQEPDLSSLFSLEKQWGFPITIGNELKWYPWTSGEPLITGTYGIPIPANQQMSLVPEQVDLILIPAVGIDRLGYRLGYGGGFYDRLLSNPQWQRIPTLGIIFEFAQLPTLPIDPWDRALDGWCSENGLFLKIC